MSKKHYKVDTVTSRHHVFREKVNILSVRTTEKYAKKENVFSLAIITTVSF